MSRTGFALLALVLTASLAVTVGAPTPEPALAAGTSTSGAIDNENVGDPAPPAAPFDAGSIITDPLFYDFGTMDADAIQEFLDSRVPDCSPSSEAPCLRDYVTDTKTIDAVPGRCANDIRRAENQTAAQVIFTVARACEVNPQVLLVTLQKEQGLVTADAVATLKYRKAMGYGCPDTAECASKYYGFFQQVYWAARSFHAYSAAPASFRYQPGERDRVAYSPQAGCGGVRITMQNRATAALYNYTPYTPNEASLANPYQEGDECSSYGNRNFWLYFNAWFGDSSLGQYLVTSGGTTWLVVGRNRWSLPAGSPQLGSVLRALGLRGAVSRDYLDNLSDRGALSPIVRIAGNSTSFYLLAAGGGGAEPVKYVIEGCDRVEALGFSCDVPVFRASVLKSYSRSAELKYTTTLTVSATDGTRFLLGPGGTRSEIVANADAGEDSARPVVPVDTSVISRIPVANPVASPGSLAIDPVTGDSYYLATGGQTTLVIDRSFLLSTAAPDWFGGVDGELGSASAAVLPEHTELPPFFTAGGRSWMVGAAGRIPLADPAEWVTGYPALDPALAALIPVDPAYSQSPLATPATIAPTLGESEYSVAGGVRVPVSAGPEDPVRVPAAVLRSLPLGS